MLEWDGEELNNNRVRIFFTSMQKTKTKNETNKQKHLNNGHPTQVLHNCAKQAEKDKV